MAAISALEALKRPSRVELHTDSVYVKNGITDWIHGWKKNGWRTADKKPVKNAELWQRLDEAQRVHDIDWRWVKGHAGHAENERADELARLAMAEFKRRREKAEAGRLTSPQSERSIIEHSVAALDLSCWGGESSTLRTFTTPSSTSMA